MFLRYLKNWKRSLRQWLEQRTNGTLAVQRSLVWRVKWLWKPWEAWLHCCLVCHKRQSFSTLQHSLSELDSFQRGWVGHHQQHAFIILPHFHTLLSIWIDMKCKALLSPIILIIILLMPGLWWGSGGRSGGATRTCSSCGWKRRVSGTLAPPPSGCPCPPGWPSSSYCSGILTLPLFCSILTVVTSL